MHLTWEQENTSHAVHVSFLVYRNQSEAGARKRRIQQGSSRETLAESRRMLFASPVSYALDCMRALCAPPNIAQCFWLFDALSQPMSLCHAHENGLHSKIDAMQLRETFRLFCLVSVATYVFATLSWNPPRENKPQGLRLRNIVAPLFIEAGRRALNANDAIATGSNSILKISLLVFSHHAL